MKKVLKQFILFILLIKKKYCFKTNNSFKIAIIGGSQRHVYKSELSDNFKILGYSVLENKSGYNYKLGLLLTLLQQQAGSSSLLFWLKNLFSKCNNITQDIILQEFFISDPKDYTWLVDNFKFDILILTQDIPLSVLKIIDNLKIKNSIFFSPKELDKKSNLILYGEGSDMDIEITNILENEKTEYQYIVGENKYNDFVKKFGKHYIYPKIIAKYISEKIIKNNDNF